MGSEVSFMWDPLAHPVYQLPVCADRIRQCIHTAPLLRCMVVGGVADFWFCVEMKVSESECSTHLPTITRAPQAGERGCFNMYLTSLYSQEYERNNFKNLKYLLLPFVPKDCCYACV